MAICWTTSLPSPPPSAAAAPFTPLAAGAAVVAGAVPVPVFFAACAFLSFADISYG